MPATEIILASHGGLSNGLLDSLRMIIGDPGDNIHTFSLMPGENPRDYCSQLKETIEGSDHQFIILSDIPGGSVHNALSELTGLNNTVLISGMNMPLALEIILKARSGMDLSDFEQILISSRNAIQILRGPLKTQDDEEF